MPRHAMPCQAMPTDMSVIFVRLRTAQVSLSILSDAEASTSAKGGDDDEDEVEDKD